MKNDEIRHLGTLVMFDEWEGEAKRRAAVSGRSAVEEELRIQLEYLKAKQAIRPPAIVCGRRLAPTPYDLHATCAREPDHKGPHLMLDKRLRCEYTPCSRDAGHSGSHLTVRKQKNIPSVCELEGCTEHKTNSSNEVVCGECSTPYMNGAPMCGCPCGDDQR